MRRFWQFTAAAAAAGILSAATSTAAQAIPPPAFVEQALCVHSGWHYTDRRVRRERPDYRLWGHSYWRTWDAPGNGEGGWTTVNSYGGGLQFTLGTWNRAAAMSHGRVPHAGSNAAVAAEPARVQILAAWYIVRSDGGSWREWPTTGPACGLG